MQHHEIGTGAPRSKVDAYGSCMYLYQICAVFDWGACCRKNVKYFYGRHL